MTPAGRSRPPLPHRHRCLASRCKAFVPSASSRAAKCVSLSPPQRSRRQLPNPSCSAGSNRRRRSHRLPRTLGAKTRHRKTWGPRTWQRSIRRQFRPLRSRLRSNSRPPRHRRPLRRVRNSSLCHRPMNRRSSARLRPPRPRPAAASQQKLRRPCSSRSRASTRPARRPLCRRRNIACCSTAWRRKSPPTG